MIGIDSNVLVRYLVQDDPRQAAAATRLVEQRLSEAEPGHISLIALAETIWVLRRSYGVAPADLATIVATLAADRRFVVQDARSVWLALEASEEGALDLSDALIRCIDLAHGCSATVTFDRKAARQPGFELLR